MPLQHLILAFVVTLSTAIGIDALSPDIAEAQTSATGFIREVRVDGAAGGYFLVRLQNSAGTQISICAATNSTYAIIYSTVAAREPFQSILTAALLSGRQVTLTTTVTAGECVLTRASLSSS